MDEETRIKALARFLEIEPDDIEPAAYGDDTFTVNPRSELQGTPPDKARELVALLRQALRIVYGEESDAWTVEFLEAEARAAAEEQHIIDHLGPIAHGGDAAASVKVSANYYAAVSRHEGRRIYSNIERVLRADPDSAKLLKVGVHDVLNTLYFVGPGCKGAAGNMHRLSLREAFDGRDVTDRREPRDVDSGQYMVLTDDEAHLLWDKYLDSYLDECVLAEMDETARIYFDREQWIEDAQQDGRGHSLSAYDGEENEVAVSVDDGLTVETLYIYRTN